CHSSALPAELWPHSQKTSLRLLFFYVGIDDARDVVLILFDFFEQCIVFFFVLVFDLVLEVVLGVSRIVGGHGLTVFALGVVGLDRRFLDDLGRFLGFLDFLVSASGLLFLHLVVLDLLRLFVLDDGGRYRFGRGLGQPCAALLQQRFGLEREGAFRTFDRPLRQVVEA